MCDVKSTWESGEGSNKYTVSTTLNNIYMFISNKLKCINLTYLNNLQKFKL